MRNHKEDMKKALFVYHAKKKIEQDLLNAIAGMEGRENNKENHKVIIHEMEGELEKVWVNGWLI